MLFKHFHAAARCVEPRALLCRLSISWLTLCVLLLGASVCHAESEPLSLRVVSYNVWGIPYIAPEREERVAQIAQRLAELSPDVVALQEVWLQQDADKLAGSLQQAGLTHHSHFGPGEQDDKGAGLWLASRYPIEQVRFVPFAAGRKAFIPWHVDYMANKGFMVAQLRTPSGAVRIANTHTQSSYIFYHYRETRLAQALQLAAGLAADAPEAPLILAGDLNDPPASLPMRAISVRTGLLAASDDFDLDAVMLRSGRRLKASVSEVRELFTEPVELPSGTTRPLSDHPCVVVDLSLSGCEGCAPATPGWPAMSQELDGALDAAADDTRTLLWELRAASLSLLVLLVLLWRRRRPRRVSLRVLLTMAALMLGGWCAYAAVEWAPYKLDLLAQQRQKIHGQQAAQPDSSQLGQLGQ